MHGTERWRVVPYADGMPANLTDDPDPTTNLQGTQVSRAYTPLEAFETIERALRQLYSHAYFAHFGADWLTRIANESTIAGWAERQGVEAARRGKRGVRVVSTNPLDYAHFYDLKSIASQHWEPLKPALGAKNEALAFLARFDQLRDTVAHNRTLLPFEVELLSGIAGEIQNRVTIYMSEQFHDEQYWPRIIAVTDSFGNSLDGAQTLETSNPWVTTNLSLRVGDVVTFACRATDPEGRDPIWQFTPFPSDPHDLRIPEKTGDSVSFSWTVQPGNIGASSGVQITMRADSAHHRWPEGRDAFAGFFYRVLPQR